MSLEVTKVDPKEYGLDVEKATGIEKSFLPKIAERDGYVSVYENILTKEITKEVCSEAKELAKKLVKVRTGIAEIHTVEKAYYLAAGRFVDALKNKLTLPVQQMEDKLKEISTYYETLEKEQRDELKAKRLLEVKKYSDSDIEGLDTMDNEMFELILSGLKTKHEEKVKAEQEAERIRIENEEKERKEIELSQKRQAELRPYYAFLEVDLNLRQMEESEYQKIFSELKAKKEAKDQEDERIRLENLKLKEEAEKAEIERKRIEAENNAKIEAERKENERKLAEAKAESDRIAAELKAEQDRKAKVEAEEKARIEAEKLEADKLAKAPIKKQLNAWVETFNIASFNGENEKAKEIENKFKSFKEWAKSEISKI